MKSLEIVNKLIIQSKRGMLIDNNEEELETIKQDLEVLEILKKKNVDVKVLKLYLRGIRERIYTIENVLWDYNRVMVLEEEKLTIEELLKLKQWLEENENDR